MGLTSPPPPIWAMSLNILCFFFKATPRTNTDYVAWPNPEEEHPTQAYPNLPIFRFPSKYKVRSVADADSCEKAFLEHNAFSAGIYSIGCGCEKNITLGFELMLKTRDQKIYFVSFNVVTSI